MIANYINEHAAEPQNRTAKQIINKAKSLQKMGMLKSTIFFRIYFILYLQMVINLNMTSRSIKFQDAKVYERSTLIF